MTTGITILARAFDLAARAHTEQRRKGDAGEPYINHLTEVVALLAESGHGNDADLLAAAALHDTVEDTDVTLEAVREQFGPDIASIVAEVTDDKSLPKADRKRLQVETAAGKSVSAKLLILADKTSNLRSLGTSPPKDWDTKRLADYVDWAEQVVANCRNLDQSLEHAFDEAAGAAREKLKAKPKKSSRSQS